MSEHKLTPEAMEFMKSMTTTKKVGTPWRKAFRNYLISHPVSTVDEIVANTRPDLVQPLKADRKRVLKNISSILNQLRKELVDVSMNDGVIELHQYFDFNKNQAVKPKATKTRKRASK